MAQEDKLYREMQRGHMATRIRTETDDILDRQEEQIIQSIMGVLGRNETLDPQFAVQQWLALHSIHRFRRQLSKNQQRAAAAAEKILPTNLTDGG